jgi:SAM-dependent methyltransferase
MRTGLLQKSEHIRGQTGNWTARPPVTSIADQNAAYTATVPEIYDRYLGPTLFEPFAADLVNRLNVPETASVLELACGTGILTRRLRDRLPPGTRLVATDLNAEMLSVARRKFRPGEDVEWEQADAVSLPFPPSAFEAVVCQFGLMFFPHKKAALREVHRVLSPGGTFAFNVWDSIGHNGFCDVANRTVCSFFDRDPPNFYDVPFGFCDRELIRTLLYSTGFIDIEMSILILECTSPSASDAAHGLVEGTPVGAAIKERAGATSIGGIKAAVARELAAQFGNNPVRATMRAIVCTARRDN